MSNIYISAGHYGYAPGAIVGKYNEADFNQKFLNAIDFGVKVPAGSLRSKIDWVNARAKKDDIAIEIHCNYSSVPSKRGIEVYYRDSDDRELAMKVDKELAKAFNRLAVSAHNIFEMQNLGCDAGLGSVHHDSESYVKSLGWCRELVCPAVIIEVEYMSNADGLTVLLDQDTPKKIANAIRNVWSPKIVDVPAAMPVCQAEKDEIVELKETIRWYDRLISMFFPKK